MDAGLNFVSPVSLGFFLTKWLVVGATGLLLPNVLGACGVGCSSWPCLLAGILSLLINFIICSCASRLTFKVANCLAIILLRAWTFFGVSSISEY